MRLTQKGIVPSNPSTQGNLVSSPAIDLYNKNNGWTAYYLVSEGLGWLVGGMDIPITSGQL